MAAVAMSSKPSNDGSIVVEQATLADADAIAKCGARTFFHTLNGVIPPKDLDEYLEKSYTSAAIAQALKDQLTNTFFIAIDTSASEPHRKVVGFLQTKLGTTEPCLPQDVPLCEVNRVYVSPDHQGKGVGALLMGSALKWAREKLGGASELGQETKEKKSAVWLGVWEEHEKQQRFYRRWGFEKVGTHGFTVGGTSHTDHVMLRWL